MSILTSALPACDIEAEEEILPNLQLIVKKEKAMQTEDSPIIIKGSLTVSF